MQFSETMRFERFSLLISLIPHLTAEQQHKTIWPEAANDRAQTV
jgi:hypothetical protein